MAQCACFGSIVQPELYIFSLRNSTTTTSTTTICFFLSYIIWECAIKFLQQNLRPMRLQKYESMLWPKKGAHIFLCDLLFGPLINYGLYLTRLFKLVTFINLMKSSYYVHICIYFNRCITNYKALILLEGVLSAQCKKG